MIEKTPLPIWLALALCAGLGTAGCASLARDDASAATTPEATAAIEAAATPPDALSAAFAELTDALRQVEADLRVTPAFATPADQVGAYRHLLRSVSKGLEAEVLQDADFPYFRILDFWLREGGDNPDQRYAFTPIRGGETYRIWGELGSALRVEFQIYAGRPWDGSGRSAGYLAFEDLTLDDDGQFEVWVSREQRPGNWIENPPEGTTLFARHIYDEWTDEPTGDIHIDRVGFEGVRRPPETREALAERIRAAATMFATTARTWPAFVEKRYVRAGPANSVSPPYDTYALGGAKGRWMSGGAFDLTEGKVVVLRIPQTSAAYQAIQLTDRWFASLEHGNQQSSLTSKQSRLAPDGAYYYVIASEDPGYPNWLDSGALLRGTFLLRWDGLQGDLSPSEFPSAEVLPPSKLPEHIPGFEVVRPGEREETLRQRRRHLQRRSHR